MIKINFKSKKLLITLIVVILLVAALVYGAVKLKNRLADQQKRISNLEEYQKTQEAKQLADQQAAQQAQIANLQNANNEQSQATEQQQVTDCENKKSDCSDKIGSLQAEITNIENPINTLKKTTIPKLEKEINKYPATEKCTVHDNGVNNGVSCQLTAPSSLKNSLKSSQDTLKQEETELATYTAQLQNLTNGDCKDYQKSCE